jgi:hypothetical protein
VAPIMLLEIDMWCLEMQLEGCLRGAVGARVCHSHMLCDLLVLLGPFIWSMRTINIGSRREGGVMRKGLGDVVVSSLDICVFLYRVNGASRV